jgi:citrate synthase
MTEERPVPSDTAPANKPAFEQVTLSAGEKSVNLPVETGTLGSPCIDIARLPKETGCFTYDPGFTATAACKSAIPTSMATPAC